VEALPVLAGCGAGCSGLGLRSEMPACAVPATLGAVAKTLSDILASSTEILRITAPSASSAASLSCGVAKTTVPEFSAHRESAENLSGSQGIASGRYTFAVLAVQRTPDVLRGCSQLAF
jgi:hypothetical protein